MALVVLALGACSSHRLRASIEGRVIDADTGQPIQGAVVILETTAHCWKFMSGYTHDLPAEQARTDDSGHFHIGQSLNFAAGCLANGWFDSLYVMAPGYSWEALSQSTFPAMADDFKTVGLDPVKLRRIRYLTELQMLRRNMEVHDRIGTLSGGHGAIFAEAARRVLSVPVRPLDRLAVFVREDGSAFEHVVATVLGPDRFPQLRTLVLADDRSSGTLRGWRATGEPFGLPALQRSRWQIAGQGKPIHERAYVPYLVDDGRQLYYPIPRDWTLAFDDPERWPHVPIARESARGAARLAWMMLVTVDADGSRLHLYRDEHNEIQPFRDVLVEDVLPGASSPVECMTEGPEGSILFVAASDAGRAVYQWTPPVTRAASWSLNALIAQKGVRLPIPETVLTGEVTACLMAENRLYLAVRGQGIYRVAVHPPGYGERIDPTDFWRAAQTARDLPTTFTGLATSEFRSVWLSSYRMIYAVGGDGVIYRFLEDGTPDQRIEIERSAPAG